MEEQYTQNEQPLQQGYYQQTYAPHMRQTALTVDVGIELHHAQRPPKRSPTRPPAARRRHMRHERHTSVLLGEQIDHQRRVAHLHRPQDYSTNTLLHFTETVFIYKVSKNPCFLKKL